MYNMRNAVSVLGLITVTYLNISIQTDYFHGARDLFGPYPRIPDAEKLKREITFAEECRKTMFAPKEVF
ncbi:uncharacterized protein LOC116842770 [Odontomachus brunneus]|uniref:uncharacterized protein LOC116842770 n=1 Tax=Odontomachus brunneus TaxID=486640 RepID=UPI0013F1FA6A|nr:uncharacterized protein LOC116842770 [Odontomachus brunneus]